MNKTYFFKLILVLTITVSYFLLIDKTIIENLNLFFNLESKTFLNLKLIIYFESLFRLIPLAIVLFLLNNESFFKFKLVFKNSIWSFLMIGIIVFFTIKSTFLEVDTNHLNISKTQIAGYFLTTMSVGFFEEFFFRLLIFGYITQIFYKHSLFFQTLITSFLFGFIHITNFVKGNQDIFSTLTQIEFAFILGVFLQILFLRVKNIVLISFLHGLINFYDKFNQNLHQGQELLVENYNSVDAYFSSLKAMLVFALLVIPLAYFYTNHSKNELFTQKYN